MLDADISICASFIDLRSQRKGGVCSVRKRRPQGDCPSISLCTFHLVLDLMVADHELSKHFGMMEGCKELMA